MSYIVLGILGLWLLLSALNQFSDWSVSEALRRRDPFQLLPMWTFFAPNPGHSDYHLLLRTWREGEESDWREVCVVGHRGLSGAIWNPGKRRVKVLSDIVSSLLVVMRFHSDRKSTSDAIDAGVMLSLPYLMLFNFVRAVKDSELKDRYEFALAETDGYLRKDVPRFIICSPRHSVSAQLFR